MTAFALGAGHLLRILFWSRNSPDKEGVELKTNDFPELREYLKKRENSKKSKKIRKQDKMLKREHSCYIDFLLKGIIGVDKERVKRILYNS